jgi:hypothetical protein
MKDRIREELAHSGPLNFPPDGFDRNAGRSRRRRPTP